MLIKKHKLIYINLLIIFIAFMFSSCKILNMKGGNKKEDKNVSFDIKAAQNTVDTYMKSLLRGDTKGTEKFYSDKLLKTISKDIKSDIKVNGYSIDEVNEASNSGVFKVSVTMNSIDKPYTVLDERIIKVIKKGKEYKIDEIKSTVKKEAFLSKKDIRLRNENNVNTNLVIDIKDVPNYIFPKSDKTNVYKEAIPKEKFGIINFSFDGKNLAISTYDNNSFIGIVNIDESLNVQAQKKDEKEDKGKGAEAGKEEKSKEIPIGKEIISLDLIKNSKIENLIFSLDKKFLLVQYKAESGGSSIRIYASDSGEIIPFKFEEKFAVEKLNLKYNYFDKDSLNFSVSSIDKKDSNNKLVGEWILDLKEFKVKKATKKK